MVLRKCVAIATMSILALVSLLTFMLKFFPFVLSVCLHMSRVYLPTAVYSVCFYFLSLYFPSFFSLSLFLSLSFPSFFSPALQIIYSIPLLSHFISIAAIINGMLSSVWDAIQNKI